MRFISTLRAAYSSPFFAIHQVLALFILLVGILKVKIENFKRDLVCSIFGPLGLSMFTGLLQALRMSSNLPVLGRIQIGTFNYV